MVLIEVMTLFTVPWVGAAALPLAGLAFGVTPDMLAGAALLAVSAVILARAPPPPEAGGRMAALDPVA